jgi:fumarate hydratase subunit beta
LLPLSRCLSARIPIARSIKKARVVAYPELGPEALMELEVDAFPATVVNDCYGADLYEEATQKYACHN